MILLRRLFMKGILCQRLEYRSSTIKHRQIFYTPLTLSNRSKGKTCIFSTLRYHSNNTVQINVLKSTGRSTVKPKKVSELKNLMMLAAPEKWRLVGAITFLLVSSAVTMAVPFCLGKLIDIIYTKDTEGMRKNLNQLCIILFGVFVVGAICNFIRVYLMSTTGHRVAQSLKRELYSAILRQETAMFDKRSTGELVGRLSGDTQLVSYALTTNISNGLRSAIMTISGMSMMFYVSPTLAGVGLSIVPPIAGVAIIYGRHLKKISKDIQNNVATLNTITEEKISNIRTVKCFAKETTEIKRYNSQLENILRVCYKESLLRGIFFGLTGFTGNAIILSVLYYSGVMISNSTITVGSLSSFLLYTAYVGISLNGLSSFYVELNKALGANTRISELIQRHPEIPIQGGKILERDLSGDIEFRNLNFAYPTRKNERVLNNFNLTIQKSTVVAVVGSSGSGKSTIASLLLRLYDPDSGRILLDGHDLRSLDPMWVKSQMSIVSQEPILFSGTIRENILYGVEDSTNYESEVENAARDAYVLQFTKDMADGLDTTIGEKGATLSGGQRQRVAIARALLKQPKILILDEATSALDAESEHYVQEALKNAIKGRTVLTIAHRLSTIKNADKIVVINQGQVAETGTYKELMNIDNGYFHKLVQHQTFA
ncbi:ATP-binding cassette sub-family B member 10, mitochondrial [Halictus rubicundus]|uniref:ATP-binding cassette sub-family B member 10, mitochondrial n=1 Tax=Halictus rubicundus TaxID=77578 RepID=UPI0040367129